MSIDIPALHALWAKATPGPWIAHGQLATAERITVCVTTAPAADQSWPCHVCYSYGGEAGSWTCEQAKANSALIAAAVNALPGLLARLELAERVVDSFREWRRQCDMGCDYEVAPSKLMDKTEAALAAYDDAADKGAKP